jgi:hypothetical protein
VHTSINTSSSSKGCDKGKGKLHDERWDYWGLKENGREKGVRRKGKSNGNERGNWGREAVEVGGTH